MEHWLDLAIIIMLIKGAVDGYLEGIKATALKALWLLPVALLAGQFSNGGALYLVNINNIDEIIKPFVVSRFPLVLAVFPPKGGEMSAASLVRGLPLPPLYQEWLTGMPGIKELPTGLSALEAVAEKFTSLIILKGVFLFYFLLLLIALKLIIKIKQASPYPHQGRLIGFLLGGFNTGIISAFLTAAFCPFLPLLGTFVAWDISRSAVIEAFLKIAFALGVR